MDKSRALLPLTTSSLVRGLLGLLLLAGSLGAAPAPSQAGQANPIDVYLDQMTPEEKVGQLFLVTFVGQDTGPESDIAQLITGYKVGGVVLLAANSNFYNSGDDTPFDVAALTNALQTAALSEAGPGLPLFVAVDHEGDGPPLTRLRSGFTPLPSAMAIGATWDTANAETVGRIAGRELSAVGVNMLLGPVVDVLNNPRLSSRGDIGTRAFGGDPYWVGEMGRAFIRGIHAGSGGRMLTVAKHFPGHGGSDRLPDDEVATVDKSFQELRRIELPPFFRVTEVDAADALGTTDGLMTSHIRYRGFQGDIRQFTPPISFDPAGMRQLLTLPEFAAWRRTGLVVSDALGVPAVQRYFDPEGETFPARQIAKEAFLAGNDVLILSQFARRDTWADQLVNIKSTVDFFAAEYRANPRFQEQVDAAVRKVLVAKLALYSDFTLNAVQVATDDIRANVRTDASQAEVARIAQEAITLIYPRPDALRERLPASPRREDVIVVVSEDTDYLPCAGKIPECEGRPQLSPTAIADAMLRLYGPEGTEQIQAENVHSLTFSQLRSYLMAPFSEEDGTATPAPDASPTPPVEPTPAPTHIPEPEANVGNLLSAADWVIFGMLDMNIERFAAADAVRLFLDLGPYARDKRVVAVALNAPYRLDTTEISKLSAYYAAYSKTPVFIDAAVRALFGDLTPTGASPVAIEGVGYDLTERLAPNPDRPIAITIVQPEEPAAVTDFPTTLHIRTEPILDHNGNPVPDGTQVTFRLERGESQVLEQATVSTTDGIAETEFSVDVGGPIYVRAASVGATSGQSMRFDFPVPTATATFTPTPRPTAVPTETPTRLPSATLTTAPVELQPAASSASRAVGLLLTLLGLALMGGLGAVVARSNGAPPVYRMRLALLATTVGLAGYILYVSGWVTRREGSLLPAAALAMLFAAIPVVIDRVRRR
jgi:beta-N-acetylhexosaminidase